jgi:hypothetical protein
MATEKTASYALNLESNTAEVSKEAAAGLEAFRAKIQASTESLKGMQGSLRSLKGASDEVKGAKAQLTAKIEAERGVISAATLAIVKQGASYDKLSGDVRKAAAAQKALDAKAAANDLKSLADKARELGESVKEISPTTYAAAAGIIALTAATVAGAIELGKFVVKQADSLRSMDLMRQASAGGEENAKNLGSQIDDLARRVPMSTEKLNELAVSLTKTLSGGRSRLGGQEIVDTFNAVAEAGTAMGDDAGKALQGIIERGKAMGRVQISPFELQDTWSTGFDDISKSLAKKMGIGIAQARAELASGRVKMADGAKAIRDAIEKNFGDINAKKMLSLDALSTRLHDNWKNLTKGINLQPILGGFSKIVALFDETSETGKAIKEIFADFGKGMGEGVQGAVPLVRTALWEVINVADELELAYLDVRDAYQHAFSGAEATVTAKEIESAKQVTKDLAGFLWDAAKAAAELVKAGAQVAAFANRLGDNAPKVKVAGVSVGNSFVEGIINGATGGAYDVARLGKELGAKLIGGAKGPEGLDAHSPSRKMVKAGHDTVAGLELGMKERAPRVKDAAEDMAPMPPMPGRSIATEGGAQPAPGAAAAAPSITVQSGPVNVVFHVDGAKEPRATAAALLDVSFLASMTKAIRQAMVTQGVPTQAPVSP